MEFKMGNARNLLAEIQAGIDQELDSIGLSAAPEENNEMDGLTAELEKTLESEFKDVPSASIQDEIARELDEVLFSDSAESEKIEEEESVTAEIIEEENSDNEAKNLEALNNIMDEVEKSVNDVEPIEEIEIDSTLEEGIEELNDDDLEGLDEVDMVAEETPQEDEAFNENELAEIMNEIEDIETEYENSNPEIEVENTQNIVTIKESHMENKMNESSLTASGDMDINLNFKVGEENIHISVDKQNGLSFKMNQISLKTGVNGEGNLVLCLPGGMELSIPLRASSSNKKAA